MRPHPRIRKIANVLAAVLATWLVVAFALAFTLNWERTWGPVAASSRQATPLRCTFALVQQGRVRLLRRDYAGKPQPPEPPCSRQQLNAYMSELRAYEELDRFWKAHPDSATITANYFDGHNWIIVVPAWMTRTGIGLALLSALALTRRTPRPGACPRCRYDRTGLAPSAVCPECGAAAPPGHP